MAENKKSLCVHCGLTFSPREAFNLNRHPPYLCIKELKRQRDASTEKQTNAWREAAKAAWLSCRSCGRPSARKKAEAKIFIAENLDKKL